MGIADRIYWVTRCLAVGPFPDDGDTLAEAGVTHVLNVGHIPSLGYGQHADLAGVKWIALEDITRIPDDLALQCLDTLHGMLLAPESRVLVHGQAGQHRAPAIAWLYFVACGVDPEEAERLIAKASFDSVPRHPRMVDAALMMTVVEHGKKHFRDTLREDLLAEPTSV